MKKGIIWLLLFVLCFSCSISQASSTNEITFQGIPWLTSPEETSKSLLKEGFINQGLTSFNIRDLKEGKATETSSCIGQDKKNKKVPYTYSTKNNKPITSKLQMVPIFPSQITATIADQTISWIFLCFTCEKDKPQLVECRLSFDANKKGIKEINNALISAYGKPTIVKNKKVNIWLGENNTIVIQMDTEVVFATLDGLALADSIEIPTEAKKNTGF